MRDAELWMCTAALWKKIAQPSVMMDLDLVAYAVELDSLLAEVKGADVTGATMETLSFLSEAIAEAKVYRTAVERMITSEQYAITGNG